MGEAIKPFHKSLSAVESLQLEFLPEKIQDYVQDVAERLQCPMDFPMAATIVVLSIAIGRRRGIRPKKRMIAWLFLTFGE